MHVIISIAGAQALKVLAEKLAQQLLVIFGLRGQAEATDFQSAILGDPTAHLAILGPAVHARCLV